MGNVLDFQGYSLLLFGGKGGCGKTTSSCAVGLYLAQNYPDKKILIISTDPAHSVGDSFGYNVGNNITPIEGLNNLWALEIDANVVGENFKKEHEIAIKKIADRGTYFDKQDIADFYECAIPGLDEIMAIIEISKLLKDGQYDLIVLDTAPTGHTLRLLNLPTEMKKWIHLMDMMQSKYRFMVKQFAGRYKKDDADEFIETMSKDINRVKVLLSNSQNTKFIPVTIPETTSIDETEKLLKHLKDYNIKVKDIIINRVVTSENNCIFCNGRRNDQKQNLSRIRKGFSDYNLLTMPLFPYQIRGIEKLKEYAQILFGEIQEYKPINHHFSLIGEGLKTQSQALDIVKKDLKFIIFGGKGGVGKTSLACATALRKALENPNKKILIFSTDPAHSLSDSFETPIMDTLISIKGTDNLYGFEMNATKILEDWKKKHRENIDETFNRFGKGVDVKFDREVMEELFTVSPPGLDELLALNEITDFVDEGRFDVYILDSAATGHLIRFLEMPQVIRDWLKTIFKLLLKYKGVVRLNKIAEEMIDFSKKVRKIQEILTDSDNAEFVAVTIPETMGFAETEDLLAALARLKIPCRHLMINMVIPPNHCNFCSVKREEQLKVVREIVKKLGKYQINQIPLFPYQITGINRLGELADKIYG